VGADSKKACAGFSVDGHIPEGIRSMDSVECLVIGAGVIGLAIARALARSGREVVVLESERVIGSGISSRNSEVIHAGIYYPSGLDKTRLCVEGKALLYAFCREYGVPHRRCGKIGGDERKRSRKACGHQKAS
jgi:glycine/D-amino acid oxidase-like deaminating enzyme